MGTTNPYYRGSSSYVGPVYSTDNTPNYEPGAPTSEPSPDDYGDWFDDRAELAPKVDHYKSIEGVWVKVGCYDRDTGEYTSTGADVTSYPPYLSELDAPLPSGGVPRMYIDDSVCPSKLMVWTECSNPAAYGCLGSVSFTSITSAASFSMPENQTSTGLILSGTSRLGGNLSASAFALSGTDAALFNIDPATAELRFNVAPDFEAPADADGDNVYEIDVTAEGVTQSIVGTVTDLVEATPPVITGVALVGGPTFSTGQQVCIDVTFDQPVDQTGTSLSGDFSGGVGSRLSASVTSANRNASYSGGTSGPNVIQLGDGNPISPSTADGSFYTMGTSANGGSGTTGPFSDGGTNYYNAVSPTHLNVDLGSTQTVGEIGHWSSLTGISDPFDAPRTFNVFTSSDGVTYTLAHSGLYAPLSAYATLSAPLTTSGGFTNYAREGRVTLPSPVTARYFRIQYTSSWEGFSFGGGIITGVQFYQSAAPATNTLTYVSGTGTNTLRYCYTVQAGDNFTSIDVNGSISGQVNAAAYNYPDAASLALGTNNFTVDIN